MCKSANEAFLGCLAFKARVHCYSYERKGLSDAYDLGSPEMRARGGTEKRREEEGGGSDGMSTGAIRNSARVALHFVRYQ